MKGSEGAVGDDLGLGESLRRIQEQFGMSEEALLEVVAQSLRDAWLAVEGTAPGITLALEPQTGRLVVVVATASNGPGLAIDSEPSERPDRGPDLATAPVTEQLFLADLPPGVSARASRLAKDRLARWIREDREHRLTDEAEETRGRLADAIVERVDAGTWYLRAGELQAYLAPGEQIPGERLKRGQHLKVVLLESRRARGAEYLEVRASRTNPLLLRRLLEAEVPEVGDGTLVLRSVTREPGERAKVAVESLRPEVDAKGACIGLKGVRIRAVVGQLAGEKVDVLEWSADPAEYVARALAPAPIRSVKIDEESRRATVTVAPDVLSLAIGREGQNARLAARLTGWRIDIHQSVEGDQE